MPIGKVIIVDGYSKALVLQNPQVLFAFDDNQHRVGTTGQAAHCRGLPNTVGIPTKVSHSTYIFDQDVFNNLAFFSRPVIEAFVKLRNHLRTGATIAWPIEGVGTDDVSRLWLTGPRMLQAIEACKHKVFSEAVSVSIEKHT